MDSLTSFDLFLQFQRERIKRTLEDTPRIHVRRVGTDDAVDPDYPTLKAYIRTETIGHPTARGRKERNIGK